MAVCGRIERQNFNITFGIGLGGVAEKSPQPQASNVIANFRTTKDDRTNRNI